jgi:hypothetical protein
MLVRLFQPVIKYGNFSLPESLKAKNRVDYLISYYRLSREFIRQNPYNLPKPISTSTQFQRPVGTTSHDIKKAGFVYQPPAFF